MDVMFQEIIRHTKIYVLDILKFKDMFNYAITKTWISRTRDKKEIPYHIHSTSHVSFVYYLNIPPYSHTTQFLNREKRIDTKNYKNNYIFPFVVGAAFAPEALKASSASSCPTLKASSASL